MTLRNMRFVDFALHSSRGKKMKILIVIPRSAVRTKSKQLHWLQRGSFILRAQHNAPYTEGGAKKKKALYNADILFSRAALLPG